MTFVLSQIFGTVAACIIIASFQFKDVRKLLIMQTVSSVLFALQFLFLNAYAGLACNVLGMFLRIAVYFRDKNGGLPGEKKGSSPFASVWFWAFCAAFAVVGAVTFGGDPVELIPSVAMIIFTYAIWNADAKFIRKLNFFICCPMWLTYNVFNFAIAGIVTEIFNMFSVALSWYRFYFKKNKV